MWWEMASYVSALIEELLSEIIRTRSFDRISIFMEINFSVKQYLYFFSLWIFLWNISKNDTKFTIVLRIKISVSSSIVNNLFIVFSRLCVKTQDALINKHRLKFYNVDWEKKNYFILFISFHRKGFSCLNRTTNVMPEFSSAMVCWGKFPVSRTFVAMS